MIKSIEATGKTEDAAIASALRELGLDRDDVSVEILELAKSGFLGIGASPARVRVNYEAPDESVPPAAAKAAPSAVESTAVPIRVSDDERAARAEAFLRGLLERMDVRADMEFSRRDNGGLCINLQGDGMGALIGRRGETLDAIQHLVNYAVNRGGEKQGHITVDAENYRSKREDSLARLAEKMAAKAVKYRRSMALEPMNSYERHIIHTALQDYEGVSTSSTGTEPNRRVVVNYERGTSSSIPRDDRPRNRPEQNRHRDTRPPHKNEHPASSAGTSTEARPANSKPVSREWS